MTETPTPATHHPYGTPTTPHVTVRGEAHLEVDPETAHIAVTLTARGTDRRTTLDDLTRRNATALDLIKTYGDAIEKLETGTLTINPELTRRGRAERIRAYHGSIQLTVTLNDFTTLGELITRLADHDLTRVDGPWWALRPTSPVHAAARRQAVQEALQRAREYADALDTRLGALLELSDTGTHTGGHLTRAAFAGTAMPFRGSGTEATADAAPVDLEPVRQTVDAHVEASFTLIPPDLG
ncbi:SIMPL domain-containing protein [Streptomyces sp. C11-1]|uniref:SIMPL domain-containing protein n=1 Tax=Streptomyces durocortorensis TaxID=2811104 RepID=A0ABY9VRC4_9ACTN|nr:SIMPL domain-containing protein [Streptomyces durocortorensis]WNF26480.1 SIMPL domain-containing protein [Streptomyces durocortorensis]